jgi:rSAM/selenodomain-associated transferase 1/rSAM/selenodomain-associated transferase 2
MKYSIVIISYNEEEKIRETIQSIKNAALDFTDFEIIVSDGGSSDNTLIIAKNERVKINNSPIGRGVQSNTGARLANGEILIFLHADTMFAINGFKVLDKAFENPKVKIGTFRMGFDEQNYIYKIYSFFTRFDSVLTSFGDQCVVVRRSFYSKLGGYPDWQIFEDVHFLRNARKETKIHSFPATVYTSARRFKKNGLILQQLRNIYYILLYYTGINHKDIKEKYGRVRKGSLNESVIIFAKFPEEGEVKTRLAKTIGYEKATTIYKKLAEHSFSEVKKLNTVSRYLFFTNELNREKISKWAGLGFSFYPQSNGNLGEKMKTAFSKVFTKGSNKTIIIGSDLPDISKSLISKAFKDLDNNDIIIGPSKDGGYYLLGMNKFYPELFDHISWSTELVLEQTIAQARLLSLKFTLLEELNDIDTIEDLTEWQNRSIIEDETIAFQNEHV